MKQKHKKGQLREQILNHLDTPKTNSQLCKLIFGKVTDLNQSKISHSIRPLLKKGLVNRSEIKFSKPEEFEVIGFKLRNGNLITQSKSNNAKGVQDE